MSLWADLTKGQSALGSSGVNIANTLASLRSGGSYDPAWSNWISSQAGEAGNQYSATGDPRIDPNTGAITIDGKVYSQVGDLDPGTAGTDRYHSLDPSQFIYDPALGVLTPQANMNVKNSALDNVMPYLVGGALAGPAIGAALGPEAGALSAADLAPLPAATSVGETIPFAATPEIVAPGAATAAAAGPAAAAATAPTVEIPGAVSQIPDLSGGLPAMMDTPALDAAGASAVAPGADIPMGDLGGATATTGAFDLGGSTGFGGITPLAGPEAAPFVDTSATGAFDVGGSTGFGGTTPLDPGSTDVMSKLLGKINPMSAAALGINLASGIIQNRKKSGLPENLANIGKPFQDQGQALLDQYKSGKLNPADEFNINKWVSDQVARVRDFYGRAGMGDSTAALNAIAQVEAQGQSMRDKSLTGLLDEGMKLMGMAIGPLESAVQAEASNDAALSQSVSSALNSFFMMQALSMGRTVPTTT